MYGYMWQRDADPGRRSRLSIPVMLFPGYAHQLAGSYLRGLQFGVYREGPLKVGNSAWAPKKNYCDGAMWRRKKFGDIFCRLDTTYEVPDG